MYQQHASLYDCIYHWKDYGQEAERVRSLLLDEGIADGARVVEAACGTGAYLVPLARWYDISGYDLNEGMVQQALAKGCIAETADMRHHRFRADAIVCLFSSIGYVAPEDLSQVAEAWYESLPPGGVVLVEPWLDPEDAVSGHMGVHTYEDESCKLVRAAVHLREGRTSVLDFHWLVLTPTGTEHFVDSHRVHLTTRDELAAPFREAGFTVRLERDGLMPDRGLLVMRK